jgi:hypothetical protein
MRLNMDDLLDHHQRVPHRLVQILRTIQASQGWLSRPDLSPWLPH